MCVRWLFLAPLSFNIISLNVCCISFYSVHVVCDIIRIYQCRTPINRNIYLIETRSETAVFVCFFCSLQCIFFVLSISVLRSYQKMLEIRPLPECLARRAQKELKEKPDEIERHVKELREWILQQPHLKARMGNEHFLLVLRIEQYISNQHIGPFCSHPTIILFVISPTHMRMPIFLQTTSSWWHFCDAANTTWTWPDKKSTYSLRCVS